MRNLLFLSLLSLAACGQPGWGTSDNGPSFTYTYPSTSPSSQWSYSNADTTAASAPAITEAGVSIELNLISITRWADGGALISASIIDASGQPYYFNSFFLPAQMAKSVSNVGGTTLTFTLDRTANTLTLRLNADGNPANDPTHTYQLVQEQ
jgi:hypothetical protein